VVTSDRPRLAARAALLALAAYRLALSPVFYFLGARCRHLPTCSDYAAEAIARHGLGRGFWLAISRLSRCHPLGSAGFDPVPARLADPGWRVWRYGDWAWTKRGGRAENAADRRAPHRAHARRRAASSG
jgi:hypothetical protein